MTTCTVIGRGFPLLMQCGLFAITCGVLIWKKFVEHSDRTWFEFGLDSSKQVAGAGWIHVANMLCAILFATKLDGVDGCTWYAANILIDTTLGVGVEWCLLQGLQRSLVACRWQAAADLLQSGSYWTPLGDFRAAAYLGQLTVWLLIVTVMKVSMVALTQAFPFLVLAVNWMLEWLDKTPDIKLFVVMICIPMMMNTFQFVLTDNFIKRKPKSDGQAEAVLLQ